MFIEQFIFFFGFTILFLLALFLFVELVFRAFEAFHKRYFVQLVRRSDYIDKDYHPYLKILDDWSKPMFKYHSIGFRLFNPDFALPDQVVNNQLGFRCDEFEKPCPEEFRVILLGGSQAWGSGASSNSATISGQLENFLNKDKRLLGSKKRAKCYNLAQISGTQTQDLLTLAFFCRKIEPNIIISLTGWNELGTNYPMKTDLLEKYGVFYIPELEGWEPYQASDNRYKFLKNALFEWGQHNSRLLHFLLSNNFKTNSEFTYSLNERESRVELCSKLFIDHLKTINSVSQSFEALHFQFLQPNLYWKKSLTHEEKKVVELYDDVIPVYGKDIGDYIRNHDIYARVLESAGNEENSLGSITDLSKVFEYDANQVFFTLVHLTDYGQTKIAEQMHQKLVFELITNREVS